MTKSPYTVAYVVAVILFLINIAIAAIQAAYTAGHGADLGITPGEQAWLAVISTVIAAALGLLPAIQRTPSVRETNYLKAAAGVLPEDLAKKHPIITPPVLHVERTEHLAE